MTTPALDAILAELKDKMDKTRPDIEGLEAWTKIPFSESVSLAIRNALEAHRGNSAKMGVAIDALNEVFNSPYPVDPKVELTAEGYTELRDKLGKLTGAFGDFIPPNIAAISMTVDLGDQVQK